jgi:hypothetical protein
VETRNAYNVLDGNPLRKIPLDSPEVRMHDNVKIDVTEVQMKWIELFQGRV